MIDIKDILDNLHDPQHLAQMYHQEPQEFEKLKASYPMWKFMARMFNPSLLPTLKSLGVPVD